MHKDESGGRIPSKKKSNRRSDFAKATTDKWTGRTAQMEEDFRLVKPLARRQFPPAGAIMITQIPNIILPRVFVVLLVALCSGGMASAQFTFGVFQNFQYSATATEVTITRYPGNLGGNITVPSTINGIPVTTIGAGAFDNCPFIFSMTLPTSIKTLGTSAFSRCSGLSSFTIPSTVTFISGNVFTGCTNLGSISVSSSNPVYSSLDGILYNKSRTALITLPQNKSGAVVLPTTLTTIRESSSGSCSRITSVSIPASVTSILSTFSSCRSLATITVDPANPNYSSRDGMLYNKDFSTLLRVPGAKTGKVVVEEGATVIGAFYAAYSVEEVVLPASTTAIADSMFDGCESLRTFVFPAGVNSIGRYAFRFCDSLEEIVIPETVQTIGTYAFRSCRSLTRVRLPLHLTVIGDWFGSCERLTDINMPPGLVRIEDSAFSNATNLANVVLPESVEHIGSTAFFVTGLRTIRIPASVTSIGNIAFSLCQNLTEIEVAPANMNYTSLDGVLYSKDLRTLIQCPAGKSGIITVPESVTAIVQNAFSYSADITAIRFMGNSPTWGSSGGTNPEILYFEGKTGFGAATWNGFTARNLGQVAPSGLWLFSHGLPYDRDLQNTDLGIPLLLAYALDIDPDTDAAAAVPDTAVGVNSISLTYFAGRSDIQYIPQFSTTLEDWQTTGIVISAADANGFRTATCPRSGGARFMRLKVMQVAAP